MRKNHLALVQTWQPLAFKGEEASHLTFRGEKASHLSQMGEEVAMVDGVGGVDVVDGGRG